MLEPKEEEEKMGSTHQDEGKDEGGDSNSSTLRVSSHHSDQERESRDVAAAFAELKVLVEAKLITANEATLLRDDCEALRRNLAEARDRERSAQQRVKGTRKTCLAARVKQEKTEVSLDVLSAELERMFQNKEGLSEELSKLEQQDTVLRYGIAELSSSRTDLQSQLEDQEAENVALVEPELARLSKLRDESRKNLKTALASASGNAKKAVQIHERVEEIKKDKGNLTRVITAAKAALVKAKAEPIRLHKQSDCIQKTSLALKLEIEKAQKKDSDVLKELERLASQQAEADEMQKSLSGKLELHKDTMVHRQSDVDAVQQTLDLARDQNHALRTEKVEAELQRRETEELLRQEKEALLRARKEFDSLKRKLKKKKGIVAGALRVIPALDEQLHEAQKTATSAKRRTEEMREEVEVLKQDCDIGIARFLQQESIEDEQRDELQVLLEEVEAAEAEMKLWALEEHKQSKNLVSLGTLREQKSAELVKSAARVKETKSQVRLKDFTLSDVKKQHKTVTSNLKELGVLYDVVRNERNTYASLIQTSGQALAEMKEKVKLLQNELGILRSEYEAKTKALEAEKSAHSASRAQRDTLRGEVNRAAMEYREKQSCIRQQISDIERLNASINEMEKGMLRLKTRYEAAVQSRNLIGIQLIDRNDELCVLYEKANIQEATLVNGELGIQELEEQNRKKKLHLAELTRRKEAARRRTPDYTEREKEIERIEDQLSEEREVVAHLSRDLEEPSNALRWRALEGCDPTMDELELRVKQVEARLSSSKATLIERELELEEVNEVAKVLEEQAVKDSRKARDLATRVNDAQSRIRDATRKMMALVSELSMYQATVMKLQEEKAKCEEELKVGRERVLDGEPPSEEALIEFDRRKRREMMAAAELSRSFEGGSLGRSWDRSGALAAESRPNAYIPDDLGIPKPYGAMAPFKPQVPGSTMRQHIRAPVPVDIEI